MLISGTTTKQDTQPGTPHMLRAMNEHVLLQTFTPQSDHIREPSWLARRDSRNPHISQALANLERTGLVRSIGQIGSKRGGRIRRSFTSQIPRRAMSWA